MGIFDPDLSAFSPDGGLFSQLLTPWGQVRQAGWGHRPVKRLPRPPGLQTGRSLASILGRDPAAEAQGWALACPRPRGFPSKAH